jgi:hypothetical protein
MGGLRHFKFRGKLAPRFIGPFKILEKRGEVAYQLELPPQLSDVRDAFHVSQLKKCLRVPEEQIPMEDLDVMEDLSYQEYPVKILETSELRATRRLRCARCNGVTIPRKKLLSKREEELKAEFPTFFSHPSESRGQDSF